MGRSVLLWICCFGIACSGYSDDLSDVTLRSIYSQDHGTDELKSEKTEAMVFFFMKRGCPAVRHNVPTLISLHEKYKARGVQVYGIYSATGTDVREMATDALEFDVPFRVFLDVEQSLAKFWKIGRTSEVVLVDADFKRHYQGAADDRVGIGGLRPKALNFFLKDALDQLLAGEKVTIASRKAKGCLMETRPERYTKGYTYYKDVAPIIEKRCQSCHRKGEVGPMPLMTLDDVESYAFMIDEVVRDRRMPPWPGESSRKFKDDYRLTDQERDIVLSWLNTDMESGNPRDFPNPKKWPSADEWQIGTPDVVLEAESYTVPATGLVPYIYNRVETKLKKDVWIQGLEVKPGARSVVHHITVYEYPLGTGPITMLDILKIYGLRGDDSILGAFVPGIRPVSLQSDWGIKLRKGMGILLEMHYTPDGKSRVDRSKLGLKFRDTPPKHEMRSQWFYRSRGRFLVPAGAEHHKVVREDIFFPKDIEILGLRPHLHARGKSFRIEKVNPKTGESETLLTVPRWDFNWQLDYYFEKPVKLVGGEELRITGYWDNTTFNPTNPDPKEDVSFGQQTEDEMMGALVIYRDL